VPHLFNWLYDAVSWVLLRWHDFWSIFFQDNSGPAWALSIVGLVVIIRILLLPLFAKQIRAQRGLQALQPQMKEIQKRYKDDRQKQSEEMMKLYKETGTNPLSSCLPIVVQAPFFFSLFHVLNYVSKDKRAGVLTRDDVQSFQHAKIFGAPIYDSFTTADTGITRVVAIVMILLMTASTFTTQRQLMMKNQVKGQDNPMAQQQKILLYVFPLMFAVFGINFPLGVLVYWLTTNVWTMGQQFYVIHNNPTPGSEAAEARERRQAAKAARRGNVSPVEESVRPSTPPPPRRQQPQRNTKAQRQSPPKKKR
jgi:YidC/Oxa1 family membrane protein insertase